jgi:IclR family pca regulon transcriptional regulator
MGRVLMAALPEAEAMDILLRHPPVRRTERTVTDPKAIMAIIAKVRAEGFAINDQEIELGLRSIAVPLFDAKGRTIAALNVGVAAAIHDSANALRKAYLDKLLGVQRDLRPLLA